MSGWDRRGRRIEFSKPDKFRILARDARVCYRCAGPATQVDHVIPVAEGGLNDPSNGRAICRSCHREKSQIEAGRGYERWRNRSKYHDPHPFYATRRRTDGELHRNQRPGPEA